MTKPKFMTATDSTQAVATIRTRGVTRYDWLVPLALAIGYAGSIPFLVLAQYQFPGTPDWINYGVPASAILAVGFLLLEFTSVRSVEMTPRQILFRYPLHTEAVDWSEVSPGRRPATWGIWFVLKNSNPATAKGMQRAYRLTLEQARALLAWPTCPRWNLSPTVLNSLGF